MRLSAYPFVVVRIACAYCKRQGQYRLARLAATYGPECDTQTVLNRLTMDCVHRTGDRRRYRDASPCRPEMIDLKGPSPRPPDFPPAMRALRVIRGGKGER